MGIDDIEMPSEIRSYKQRSGRMGPLAAASFERQWPLVGFDVPRNPHRHPMPALHLHELFGNDHPVVMEIGFGMGDATAQLAREQRDTNTLACDVHVPGIALLCKAIEDDELTNIRIAKGDVVDLLRDHLQPASISGVRIFFPDPWPKKRHHKRRLIQTDFLDLLAPRLQGGAVLHFATDWDSYAEHTREVIATHPMFVPLDEVPARPGTRYEAAGHRAGRTSTDIAARRV